MDEYPEAQTPAPRGVSEVSGFAAPSPASRRRRQAGPRSSDQAVSAVAPLLDRLERYGSEALLDHEILEFLLRGPLGSEGARSACASLLTRHGSFARVVASDVRTLAQEPTVGPDAALLLKCIHSAALRLIRTEVTDLPVLSNWDRLMSYLTAALAREKVEQFRVLFLDSKNRLIADEAMHHGTVNHAPVYPREVIRRALELHATALILIHNHPTGDPTPSQADVEITAAVVRAADTLDISVHDHVIIASGAWASLRQLGLL